MQTAETAVVEAWHDALNAADADRVVRLSSTNVEVGGPRGSGRGAHLLREWISRAGIQLHPHRVFQRGETVIVEQSAQWRSPETGELTDPQDVASVFVVRSDLVDRVVRYPDLMSALHACGLDEADER